MKRHPTLAIAAAILSATLAGSACVSSAGSQGMPHEAFQMESAAVLLSGEAVLSQQIARFASGKSVGRDLAEAATAALDAVRPLILAGIRATGWEMAATDVWNLRFWLRD